MSRDPWKLKVFVLADELVVTTYRLTRGFPHEERFGLQSQIRRGAVSAGTNIVEGCARRSLRDYVHFLWIAVASASEVRYLLGLAARLAFIEADDALLLAARYDELIRGTQKLIASLEQLADA